MNMRAIRAIVRKDLKVVFQNKGVSIPIIVVPLIILTGIPAIAFFAPLLENVEQSPLQELAGFISNMPMGIAREISGLSDIQTMVYLMLVYFLAPLYLVLPLMVASVIAADSFAGKRSARPWRPFFTRLPRTESWFWPRCYRLGCRRWVWPGAVFSSIAS